MRLSLVALFFANCFDFVTVHAQTLTINGGSANTGTHLYNLVYTWYQAPRTQRLATHYPSAQIAAGSMVSGANITSLELERVDLSNTLTLPTGANVKIYLENRPSASLDLGAGTLTWSTLISTATLVFEGDPSTILGNSAGWKTFNFGTGAGTASSFTYTGGALVVYSDYIHTTAIGGSTTIPMQYATAAQGTPSPSGWTTNSTKYSNNSTTTPPTSIATSTANHPHIKFNYSSGVCINPPTPGTASASPATPVCSAAPVALNISGNTVGSTQTYQWFSDPSQFGSYSTAVSGVLTSPSFLINPTSTLWYRCVVTCGASANTTPVQVIVSPPLSASTFTIGPGGDFATFAAAIGSLNCGIAGPIVFNVLAGSPTFNEQISIPSITGSSATNTITFNGNGNTISFSATASASPHTIALNGADYFTFNNLNIIGLGATYALTVHLWNGANNNTFSNCTISSPITAGSTTQVAYSISGTATSYSGTGVSGNDNTVTGCTISGGYYAVTMYSATAAGSEALNNSVVNCTIRDAYSYSCYILYQKNTLISGNDISRPNKTTSTTTAGVYLSTGSLGCKIEKNRIHNMFDSFLSSTSTCYGVGILADGTAAFPNTIENNLIYNMNGNGAAYGLYNSTGPYSFYYHNTIALDDQATASGAAYGIYQTGATTGIVFNNNIVQITRSGTGTKRCIYFVSATTGNASNNNVFYMNATGGINNHVGQYTSTNYPTLADWKTANGNAYDQASVDGNPIFTSPGTGDYTPTSGLVNNAGTAVPVPTDILGNSRSATTPDPGAYEFVLLGLDAGITWVAPVNPNSAGLKTVIVNINNTQAQTISGLDLAYTDGGVPVTESFTGLSILPGNNQQISFTAQYNLTQSTSLRAYISAVNGVMDASQLNDTTDYTLCIPFPAGTYTINSAVATGGTNFQTFTEAVDAMVCGIAGPVIFNVDPASGPYNEQISIPVIPGSSAVNTITFNGNGRTIQFASANINARYVIQLNGADYVHFDNLVIGCSAGTYGWGIHLTNQSNNNSITNCTINSSTTNSTSNNFSCIVFSGSPTAFTTAGNNGNNNTISGNTLNGGYYTMVLYGNSTAGSENLNNTVTNNILTDSYSYTLYLLGQKNPIVSGNDFSRPTRTTSTTTAAVFLTTGCLNALVEKNRVHNYFDAMPSSTSTCYTFYVAADGTAAEPNRYINNLVYNMSGNGSLYGIYNTTGPYMKAYHNTIVLDNASATEGITYGFYQTGTAAGLEYKNNLIFITRGGVDEKTGLNYSATGSSIISNNNNIYMNSAGSGVQNIGSWGTTDYTTLATWQTANGGIFDGASVSANPFFQNPGIGNYKPTALLCDDIGTNVGVTTDILGTSRSATTPDAGAYEFAVAAKDIGVDNIVSPNSGGCYSSTETFVVTIKNFGGTAIDFSTDPVIVTADITGQITTTVSATLSSGTLAAGASQNVTLSPTVDGTANGTYNVSVYTSLASDGNNLNDAFPLFSLTVGVIAGTVSATQTNVCATQSMPTLTLAGNYGGAIQWQQSTVSSSGPWTNIGTGNSTYTPASLTQTTYYNVVVTCNTNSSASNVVTVNVSNPQLTGTQGASRCGPGVVALSATTSSPVINWYANATGGIPLATGNTFSPFITGTTTYYASASDGGGLSSVGPLTNAIGGGASQSLTHYLEFDVLATSMTLQGVYVYPSAAGNVVLHISNSSGTNLTIITHPVTAANINLKTYIPVNFVIPAGVDYRMGWASGGVGIFRNDAGAVYPYTIPNIVSITGNSFDQDYYYYCYDWQVVTGCEGTRTAVTATMTTPPPITVSPNTIVCGNVSATLTASSPNDPNYTYTWTPGNLTGSSVSVNPTVTTTYTVNALDNSTGPNSGCANIGSVTVSVNPSPTNPVITPASALLCEDDTVKLKAYSFIPHTGTFGTQSAQNTSTTYPAPYSAYFGSQRMQMLITAAELSAQGYTAGSQFASIKFPVVAFGANWGSSITSCNSFQVSIGATSLSSISTFQTGLTQVVSPGNFTPSVGYNNTHTFSSPFTWNGTSNIIIETTFGNDFAGVAADHVIMNFATTSYQSTILYRADNVTAAAAAAATTVSASYSSRSDFKLLGTASAATTWSPLTDLFTDDALTIPYTGGPMDSVYSHPSVTRTYTSSISFGGCPASNTVTVTVDVIPQVNITAAGPTAYCPGSTVTLNASTDPTYTNYAWTPAGPSGPGATSFTVGGATNSTTVYTVTATGAGGCTSHQDIPVTVYDTVSPAITVIGNPNLCSGQTTSDLQGDIFGATGPAQSYAWSTSETTQLITVTTSGTYSLVTTDVNGCLTHNAQVITESTAPTAPIVTPAGPINLCSFDGGNTYNAATLTVTNYSSDLQWSTSETTTSIIVDYPDNFFAIYTDPSGCYSVSNTVTTSTYLASDAATGATSDASFNTICLGNTVTLTVDGGFLGDGADWHWYEGSCIGGTPRGTGSSVTLTPTTSGLHTYYVRAEGICNTTTCASISIQVSTAPPPYGASITTYPVSGCNGTTAVMSGPVVSGASFYNWSCAQGGVLFNGSPGPVQTATPTVTVTFVSPPPAGASGYSICVFAGNGCGQSLTFCRFVRARVSQPSAISGSIIACANTNSIYSVGAVAGADTYTWTVTGNATINGGTNTITTASNSVTVNFLPGWSTGTLSVYSSLNCGFNSAARSLAISSTPAVPGVMGGPGYVCPGSSASFNVPAVNGAASYNWTTSVPGAVISPSSNSASILFPAVIPAGSTVCVTAVSSCGNASAARCKSIANGIPNIPGNISGPVSGQCAQSGVSYSVIPVAQATAYLWTATGGASVSGPNNLSAVSINFPSGFVTCTLSVVAQNSCGSSTARTLIVNGAPAQPGTISGSQSVCNGAVEPYSTTGSTGATSYGWAVPVGATILNTPPYGSSILVMWGATGGNVTVNATNDCGSSTMRTLSVAVTCREAQVSEVLQSTATLYPNPTGGKTTLQFESKADVRYSIQVLDVTGRMILSENISAVEGSNMHELDFTTIAKGMYLIRLESSDAEVQLLKLTVE